MFSFDCLLILTILKRTGAGRDMFFTGLVVVLIVISAALVLSAIVVLIVGIVRLVFYAELLRACVCLRPYSRFLLLFLADEERSERKQQVRANLTMASLSTATILPPQCE